VWKRIYFTAVLASQSLDQLIRLRVAQSSSIHVLYDHFDVFFTRSSCSRPTTRGHNYKLFLRYSRLNIRQHFFSERVVTAWNNLECNVIDFSSFKCFKVSLLSCDLSKYVHF